MNRYSLACACIAALLLTSPAAAEVRPHALFANHMVLQHGVKVPVWGRAGPGEKITVRFQGQEVSTSAGADGRWRVQLEPLQAGGPFEMIIKGTNEVKLRDVLVGEVWICSGQSNMEWPLSASNKPSETATAEELQTLRLFQVPRRAAFDPEDPIPARWQVSSPDNLRNFSAVAYFFGRELQKSRKMPIGLIQSAWGGTTAEAWTSPEYLEKTPELRQYYTQQKERVEAYRRDGKRLMREYEEKLAAWKKENPTPQPEGQAGTTGQAKPPPFRPPVDPARQPQPSQLYSGMIHPLVPFAFRGVIWYQGESNASRAYEYRTLMPTLIQSWRAAWNQGDFPFLMVQLAPYERGVAKEVWPELREAQAWTATKLPHVGLAIITDAGDPNDIHPRDKETVGKRLALLARNRVYGEPVVACGPVFESATFENGKATIRFSHLGGGLMAKGEELKGFMICGRDQKFLPAQARIVGECVVVEHPDVPEPVAVRFAWSNAPDVNLFNKEGLPAAPFRSDDFELLTKPKPAAPGGQ